jgi:hypothetical protein
MSTHPARVDIRKTRDFLFELGSLMVTVFGAIFVLDLCYLLVGAVLGLSLRPGYLVAMLCALMLVNGVGLLYFSTQVSSRVPR